MCISCSIHWSVSIANLLFKVNELVYLGCSYFFFHLCIILQCVILCRIPWKWYVWNMFRLYSIILTHLIQIYAKHNKYAYWTYKSTHAHKICVRYNTHRIFVVVVVAFNAAYRQMLYEQKISLFMISMMTTMMTMGKKLKP